MKIILRSLKYFSKPAGIGDYKAEMSPELVERDLQVSVYYTTPYYLEW